MSSQADFGRAYPDYGSADAQYEQAVRFDAPQLGKADPADKGVRKPVDVTWICRCVFLPWLLYAVVFAFMCFSVRYISPGVTKFVNVLTVVLILVMAFVTLRARRQIKVTAAKDWGPSLWQPLLCVMLLAAFVGALICGDFNYWDNLQPYYDSLNLQYYAGVDPSKYWGQQLMDAGRVRFTDTTILDVKKSMGFRNEIWYCVVPITSNATASLASYDFWAVGTNCCSGPSTEFRCGEYTNPSARSGLRLMRDEQRPFFRLAVRQAEAAFNIKSPHPIFFHWMEDPLLEVSAYRDEGYRFYVLWVFGFFGINLFCIVAAAVVLTKLL